jgi:hypothetical protein
VLHRQRRLRRRANEILTMPMILSLISLLSSTSAPLHIPPYIVAAALKPVHSMVANTRRSTRGLCVPSVKFVRLGKTGAA